MVLPVNLSARNMELRRRPRLSRISLLAAALYCAVLSAGNCPAADDLARDAAALKARYAADLSCLAAWCRQKNLAAEERITTDLVAPPDPYKIVLPVLSQEVGSLYPPKEASGDLAVWHRRLLKLRQDQGAALFGLAQRAVRRHQASLAYRLALDAIKTDPDHEAVRHAFGYQKYQNQWHTPYEVLMLRSGMVWSDRFGWIEKVNLPRYVAGERLFGVTWIDAANDATLHAEITNGWDVETEHYRIRTNHSIEAAVALGVKLENLHRIWRQIFLGYYSSEADVEALFSGRLPRNAIFPSPTLPYPAGGRGAGGEGRLEVVYFRDKEQYHRALTPIMPDVGISMGLYVPGNHTAYFYAGSEDSQRTMYHEATHQLFQQSRRVGHHVGHHVPMVVVGNVGRKANCWLIEGIAMYMETLRRPCVHGARGDCFVLGGLDDVRMQAARYHLQKKDFYVPFEKLVRMGVQDVQGHPEIAKLYSQIAAMTNFLVHYDDGRYRDALVRCLASIYDGNQDPDLLAHATGASYAELDEQYERFMKIAAQPSARNPKSETRNPKQIQSTKKANDRN